MKRACETCEWWEHTGSNDKGQVGECRKNSPEPLTMYMPSMPTEDRHQVIPPQTSASFWCAQWVRKEGVRS